MTLRRTAGRLYGGPWSGTTPTDGTQLDDDPESEVGKRTPSLPNLLRHSVCTNLSQLGLDETGQHSARTGVLASAATPVVYVPIMYIMLSRSSPRRRPLRLLASTPLRRRDVLAGHRRVPSDRLQRRRRPVGCLGQPAADRCLQAVRRPDPLLGNRRLGELVPGR